MSLRQKKQGKKIKLIDIDVPDASVEEWDV
jgi:hypothetical protein